MKRKFKYVNSKIYSDVPATPSRNSGGARGPQTTQIPRDVYNAHRANEDFISGKGTPIAKGETYYAPQVHGTAVLARADLVVEKLKRNITHPPI